jgi:predicted Zn-dependent protease
MAGRELITDAQREALDAGFETAFFEAVLRSEPRHVEALHTLGHLYTTSGRYVDGLDMDRRLAELLPDEPVVHYNLACSLALTGQPEQALGALRHAIDLGYDEADHMLADDDLQSLRGMPAFLALVERVRKGGGAKGAHPGIGFA